MLARTASADPEAPRASVLIYMKSLTVKKHGLPAHVFGYKDSSESLANYNPRKAWWEGPALLHEDAPIPDPDISGGADCEAIKGIGGSSNVAVTVTLICHADVRLKALAKADCMKGTITARASASAAGVRRKRFAFEVFPGCPWFLIFCL